MGTTPRCTEASAGDLSSLDIREGAHTLTQVANRTTATMGECGGSCTPEVQALIEELEPKYATAAPSAASNKPAQNGEGWWVRKK